MMGFFDLSDGERLYYEDTVDGDEVLVFVHGWMSTHEAYKAVVQGVGSEARCITYDQRGHGLSREACQGVLDVQTLAHDLRELLEGLGLCGVNLFGWSMGADVVMTYLEEYGSDMLRQVILCDMTPRQVNDDTWKLGLYKGSFTEQDRLRDAGKSFEEIYEEFARKVMPGFEMLPSFFFDMALERQHGVCDEHVAVSLCASLKEQDHRSCFRGIDIPVAYFYADPGSLFSPELADWYAQNVSSKFTPVRFCNATHMLVAEQPAEVARELASLLRAP